MVPHKEGKMNRQRWVEIMLEDGFSQHAIDSLWGDKPDDINVEELSEEAVRASNKVMKEAFPDWATRKDDEGFCSG